nr:hypothetical protein CFP56_09127 [Quercus suber]
MVQSSPGRALPRPPWKSPAGLPVICCVASINQSIDQAIAASSRSAPPLLPGVCKRTVSPAATANDGHDDDDDDSEVKDRYLLVAVLGHPQCSSIMQHRLPVSHSQLYPSSVFLSLWLVLLLYDDIGRRPIHTRVRAQVKPNRVLLASRSLSMTVPATYGPTSTTEPVPRHSLLPRLSLHGPTSKSCFTRRRHDIRAQLPSAHSQPRPHDHQRESVEIQQNTRALELSSGTMRWQSRSSQILSLDATALRMLWLATHLA